MAATELVPKNGAVTFGTFTADFASFDIEAQTAVDNVTPYGSNVASRNASSATPDYTFNVGAFMTKSSTGAPPLLGSATTNIFLATQALTLTLDTGTTACTESCSAFVQRFRISHARMRGYVPAAITFKNQGEITEVWADYLSPCRPRSDGKGTTMEELRLNIGGAGGPELPGYRVVDVKTGDEAFPLRLGGEACRG
jgi:hypothetical protein